jgi:hypothetical protein
MKMENKKTMSDRKHSDKLITNEDTVNRRAWIEKAVSVVKGKFTGGEDSANTAEQPNQPNLYVVDTKRPR